MTLRKEFLQHYLGGRNIQWKENPEQEILTFFLLSLFASVQQLKVETRQKMWEMVNNKPQRSKDETQTGNKSLKNVRQWSQKLRYEFHWTELAHSVL